MTFKRKYKKSKSEGKISHHVTTVDGIKFDSEMESKYYKYLLELKKQGIVKEFTLQPNFLLQEKFINLNGDIILGSNKDFEKIKRKNKLETISAINYISDFDVIYTDGHREIIDIKGLETPEFRLKLKLFKYKYPELNIRLLILYKNEWIDLKDYKKLKSKGKTRQKT